MSVALRERRLRDALMKFGVLAASEHRAVLRTSLATIVDVGANRGQFALAARMWAPNARVISFEPLDQPADIFRRLFAGDDQVTLHRAAIGPVREERAIHVSARDDSSSLLPISKRQVTLFPGTHEVRRTNVVVGPLSDFISAAELRPPAMLKIDVQGFEYNVLVASRSLLPSVDEVYCECSFVELYEGQRLASDVVGWLKVEGFAIAGAYNVAYDSRGAAIQADLHFKR